MSKLSYRPEIDGLRAIAVIAVILFHMDITLFSGGFIGVDIFFTISGYLITGIIFKGSLNYNYLLSFYSNRFWRLFPSLLITTLLTTIIAISIFPLELAEETVKSAVSSITFISNIYFYLDTGYWDFTSKFKPLLHTWSLGVEEQFYIFYPLLIIFLINSSFKNLHKLYFIFIVISLFLTITVTYINPNLAFFMSPFRLYEFMLGGFAWIIAKEKRLFVPSFWKEIIVFISLIVIFISFFTYGNIKQYPSWWPLIPCTACGLILVLERSLVSKTLLTSKPQVYIGKLSYTLYLVHWPVIVFLSYRSQLNLSYENKILSIVLTYVISIIINKLIEIPFRYNRNVLKHVLILLITCAFLFSAYYFKELNSVYKQHNPVSDLAGLPGKYINLKRQELRAKNCSSSTISDESCLTVSPESRNILIVGDSHGIDGYNILKTAYPKISFLLMSERGCPHLINGQQHNSRNCKTGFNDVYDFLKKNNTLDTVVYSIRMDLDKIDDLAKTTKYLVEKQYKVIVLGIGPWFNEQTRITAHKFTTFNEAKKAIEKTQKKDLIKINNIAKDKIIQSGGKYIDKLNYFCPMGICNVYTNKRVEMVTYDRNHLSFSAAKEFGQYIKIKYRKLLDE